MSPDDPLLAAEAVFVAEETASALRHDLRNRLAIIRGAAYYVRRRVAATELWSDDLRLREIVSGVEGEVDAATNLLVEKLTFARLRVSRPRAVTVAEFVSLAIGAVRVEPERAVRVRAEVAGARVHADPVELALALRCLIENSVEASPDGGEVLVRAEVAGGAVRVEVVDGGPGLGREVAERALMPFETTKVGHRGLGLNIARRISRKLGGDVVLRDGSKGTTFGLDLPLFEGSHVDAAAGG